MYGQVTVIIPAYNEAERLTAVISVVQQAASVQEIIVVDDGSQDETAEIARQCGAQVIQLPENCGKGTAMRHGALAACHDIILFLDADLMGLTAAQVEQLIAPVLTQQAEMSIGIFRSGRTSTDLAQLISPCLSGQRCLDREFFLNAPLVAGSRSGVEMALTIHAHAHKMCIARVMLDGVTHPMKEEKMGLLHGILARGQMYLDILVTFIRYRRAISLMFRTSMSPK